jgi:NADH-quinone oxidoreductase subunit E
MSPPKAKPDQDGWVKRIAKSFPPEPKYLIPILQAIQADEGYLPLEAMRAAARHLRVPESRVSGVATFYAQFRFDPPGKHKITVCRGTACHVRGSAKLVEYLGSLLKVEPGKTTEDGLFTLETVACVGSCALAPLIVLDGKVYGRQTSSSSRKSIEAIRNAEKDACRCGGEAE